VLLSAFALCASADRVVSAQSASANDVHRYRDRLDRYLTSYEPQLSTVVADEVMTQRTRDRGWVVTHRRIESEVAFIALPGRAAWMGFRRVVKVNGKTVADSGVPLARLMAEGARDDYDKARVLLAESAAHNLGAPRTINLPNLPLELLHPRHRHRFAHELYAREKVDGAPAVVLQLDETSTPTIIQQAGVEMKMTDMKTVVWATIEAETGRLLRAKVTASDARLGTRPFIAELDIKFKDDKKVGMMVPAEMSETFFVSRSGGPGTGTAKYSNYRRFTTAARIVPQP
jgi:hypothetical protein